MINVGVIIIVGVLVVILLALVWFLKYIRSLEPFKETISLMNWYWDSLSEQSSSLIKMSGMIRLNVFEINLIHIVEEEGGIEEIGVRILNGKKEIHFSYILQINDEGRIVFFNKKGKPGRVFAKKSRHYKLAKSIFDKMNELRNCRVPTTL